MLRRQKKKTKQNSKALNNIKTESQFGIVAELFSCAKKSPYIQVSPSDLILKIYKTFNTKSFKTV